MKINFSLKDFILIMMLVLCITNAAFAGVDPMEVILYTGKNFDGEQKSIRLEPWMHQRIVDLRWTPFKNFRSIRVGSQVLASAFSTGHVENKPNQVRILISDGPYKSARGEEIINQKRNLPGDYLAIVLNHLRHIKHSNDPRLPFGVLFRFYSEGGWSTVERYNRILLPEQDNKADCVNCDLFLYQELTIMTGALGPSAIRLTLFSEENCQGQSIVFPQKADQDRYNLGNFGWGQVTKSVRVEWTGPKLPDRPINKALLPPTYKTLLPNTDIIHGFRRLKQSNASFLFEIDYSLKPSHPLPVYVGGWLYTAGNRKGSYKHAAITAHGTGSVQLWLTLDPGQTSFDGVEFFMFEGGKDPFISKQFTTQFGAANILPPAPAPVTPVPNQANEAIKGFQVVNQSGLNIQFEIQYRIDSSHGGTVYVGGWLYHLDKAFGGYQPAVITTSGDGSVQLRITLDGPGKVSDQVEFFFMEPGKQPFLKERFPLKRQW